MEQRIFCFWLCAVINEACRMASDPNHAEGKTRVHKVRSIGTSLLCKNFAV